MEWYTIANMDTLDTPALVIYPERVKQNIRKAIEMVGDPARLRPHIKTHKSPETTKLMLDAGIKHFKCATIAEAEMLAMAGAPDVLLAYQPIGPKAKRFAELIKKYPGTHYSCLVDAIDAAREIAAIFTTAGLSVPVWLDINVGMDRTGITPGPEAESLYNDVWALAGLTVAGLHAYDGHIRDAYIKERTKKCDEGFDKVIALQQAIRENSGEAAIDLQIVAGGSPTFPIHSKRPNIQCSPGTFVYWDKGYSEGFKEQPFLHAALVVTRVVSLRGESRLCLDLGHKSIAAENELTNRVYFLNAPELKPVGQSEEHLVVEAGKGHSYKVGDIFYGVPVHICPTVALYERAYTINNNFFDGGEFKNSARDRRLTV